MEVMFLISEIACGKLYLAGEYAVLIDKNPAILVGVNRLIQVDLKLATTKSKVIDDFENKFVFDFSQKQMFINKEDNNALIIDIISFLHDFLLYHNKKLLNFEIKITNNLFIQNTKIGLGSSAALSIALVKAILKLHGFAYDSLLLYKIVVMAHLKSFRYGSYGDIACSCFGGYIYYQKPEQSFLKNITFEDLDKEWPLLVIERIKIDSTLKLVAFWTQEAADTTDFIRQFLNNQLDNQFLEISSINTKLLKEYLVSGKNQEIQTTIHNLYLNLKKMSQKNNMPIMTNIVENIIDNFSFSIKTSGAGGGDCLISIIDKNLLINLEDSIHYLNLEVFNYE